MTPPPGHLRPLEALLCVLASLTGLITLGPLLVSRLGLAGILLSELGLVGLPTIGFLSARGLPPWASLGLDRVRFSTLLGGLLAGAGAFWLTALLETTLLERILPVPPEVTESLKRLAQPGASLALDLAALALAPALCEEALFRGVTLPALRGPLGRAGAVVVTALLFAVFHLSIYRFVPTALLGLALGAVRLAAGSLWPAVIFHATNNALVLVMVRAGFDSPLLPTNVSGIAALAAAVLALTGGFAILVRAAQRN